MASNCPTWNRPDVGLTGIEPWWSACTLCVNKAPTRSTRACLIPFLTFVNSASSVSCGSRAVIVQSDPFADSGNSSAETISTWNLSLIRIPSPSNDVRMRGMHLVPKSSSFALGFSVSSGKLIVLLPAACCARSFCVHDRWCFRSASIPFSSSQIELGQAMRITQLLEQGKDGGLTVSTLTTCTSIYGPQRIHPALILASLRIVAPV